MKNNIATKVIDAGGKLTVRSALNPILWLCAIVTIPALVSVPFLNTTPNWLIFIICSPVACALAGFLFLLLFDRDKLQSEDFQIRKQSLELIQQKGDAEAEVIDMSEVEAISNPEIKSIESNSKEARQ